MKVTIKDRELLSLITVDQIIAYIKATGWEEVGEKDNGKIWAKDGKERRVNMVVPLVSTQLDYIARITEILFQLEQFEGRSQLNIYSDISRKAIIIKPTPKNKIKA